MTMIERLLNIELKLDNLEYQVVFCISVPIDRRRYWRNTRPIRRGSILKMYLDEKKA
jgi:hypothetical protein